jgi:hypothetical protein
MTDVLHIKAPWNWHRLGSNPSITMEDIFANFDQFWGGCINYNPNLTLKDVFSRPDIGWSWSSLCQNPAIPVSEMIVGPSIADRNWFRNWRHLSWNPNMTFDYILLHADKPWNWYALSSNEFRYAKNLQQIHIRKMKKLRERMRTFTLPKWYKLSCLVKTKAFCEWYYAPDNIGGQISKRRIAHLFNQ